MIKANNNLSGKLNAGIIKQYPELEDITITPQLEEQILKSEKYGFNKVTVGPIPAVEIKIAPTLEEKVETGIFNKVTVDAIPQKTLNITPTELEQAEKGIFTQVNVGAIEAIEITPELNFASTNSIELKLQDGQYIKKATIIKDINLKPENIKAGISLFGVEGNLADTNDADATAEDIILNKTAYVANARIRGTFEPLDTSDATAAAKDIAEGKTAYVNGEKIIGTLENLDTTLFRECSRLFVDNTTMTKAPFFDTSSIVGMPYMFQGCTALEEVPNYNTDKVTTIASMFRECKALKEVPNYNTSKVANMSNLFYECLSLTKAPNYNTSKVTTMQYMFAGCTSLEEVPIYSTSLLTGTGMQGMFNGCNNLSDESLNNIMQMCINATKITSSTYKKLSYIGLSTTQINKCKTLSNYQTLLDKGWT